MATIAETATLTRLLTKTTTTSFTNAQLLIAVNACYERITGIILSETSGGRWKWGDINYTAFPTYTQNMTNSEPFYQIDSLTGVLVILGVEVLDNTGIWHPLEAISLEDIQTQGIAQLEYLKTDGRPIYYEKRENAVVLYPAPDNGVTVTLTAGLRILFLRGSSVVTDMTATTSVGIPSPWNDALAYGAAYIYAIANGLSNANQLKAERDTKEKELLAFISRRNQDDRPIMTNRVENYL